MDTTNCALHCNYGILRLRLNMDNPEQKLIRLRVHHWIIILLVPIIFISVIFLLRSSVWYSQAVVPVTWTTTTPSGFTGLNTASTTVVAWNGSFYGTAFGVLGATAADVYFATSSDGLTWSSTTTVTTTGAIQGLWPMDLAYNSVSGYFALIIKGADNNGYFTTSSNGVSWSNPRIAISSLSSTLEPAYIDINSAGGIGMAYMKSPGGGVRQVTFNSSTSGASWDPSGFFVASSTDMVLNGFDYSATDVPYVLFGNSDAAYATIGYYAVTSTNGGYTWGTKRLVDTSSSAMQSGSSFALDGNGNPRLTYVYSNNDQSVIEMRFASSSNGVNWTTTTVATVSNAANSSGWLTGSMVFIGTTPYFTFSQDIGVVTADLRLGTFSNTNTLSLSVVDALVGGDYGMATLATNGTTDIVVGYTEPKDGKKVSFGRVAAQALPTATALASLATSTDGTGLVSFQTTVADTDNDITNLVVEFSTSSSNGTDGVWASSTLGHITPSEGAVTTSTGNIAGIDTDQDGSVTLTIQWNSLTDLADVATSSAYVRVVPRDNNNIGSRVTSASFALDNAAPSAPSPSVAVSSTRAVVSWTAVSGASNYTVSSTASSASTTSNASVTFSSLTPNTSYQFQVKSTDSVGNASSFSTATSTYTLAALPVGLVGTPVGVTRIDLSWDTNNNPAGTLYQVYNATTLETVTTTSATSYSVTGLLIGTPYNFQVRTQNSGDSSYTAYTSALSVSTNNVSGSAPAPSAVPAPVTPATPAPAPEATAPADAPAPDAPVPVPDPANPARADAPPAESSVPAAAPVSTPPLPPSQPMPVYVGGQSHTVTLLGQSGKTITVQIESKPTVVELELYGSKDIDTDGDGNKDLRVAYVRKTEDGPVIEMTPLQPVPSKTQKKAATPDQKQKTAAPSQFTFTRYLFPGRRGEDVQILQSMLFDRAYLSIQPTGYFGELTWRAVRSFQKDNGLPQPGFVGPRTRMILNRLLEEAKSAQ